MQAATLSQLEMLEEIIFTTKLRGEAAGAELKRRLEAPTKPLYVHNKGKQERFYRDLYKQTFNDGSGGIREDAPEFLEWLTPAEYAFIYE